MERLEGRPPKAYGEHVNDHVVWAVHVTPDLNDLVRRAARKDERTLANFVRLSMKQIAQEMLADEKGGMGDDDGAGRTADLQCA